MNKGLTNPNRREISNNIRSGLTQDSSLQDDRPTKKKEITPHVFVFSEKDDYFHVSDYVDVNDSLHNITMLEDFEVYDGRDILNVVAYTVMSTGGLFGPFHVKIIMASLCNSTMVVLSKPNSTITK